MTAFKAFGDHPPLPLRAARPSGRQAGKVILVTGAAGGVGAALVRTLVEEGAQVAATDFNLPGLQAGVAEFGDAVRAIRLDVADQASVTSAIGATLDWAGRIDGVVNAAAIALHQPPLDTDIGTWRRQFEVNVFGAYEVSRQAAKAMIAAGIRGAIVNVASEAGKIGHPETLLAYSATKAAIINMTRMLSAALAANDINVNCVCPGSVATPMLREVAEAYGKLTGLPPDAIFDQMTSSQLKRHTAPEEVARSISFLLSDDAMLIRGQAINTDGGDTPY